MKQSSFRYTQIPDSLRVSPHSRRYIGKKRYVRRVYPYNIEHAPSSTLNASAFELSLWMMDMLQQLRDANNASVLHTMVEPSTSLSSNIGLGFQRFSIVDHQAYGHFGGDTGFRSLLVIIPDQNIGIVVLGNCDYEEDFRQEIVRDIAALLIND